MQTQPIFTIVKCVSHWYFQSETNLLARFGFLRFLLTLVIEGSNLLFGVLMLVQKNGKNRHFALEIPARNENYESLKMIHCFPQSGGFVQGGRQFVFGWHEQRRSDYRHSGQCRCRCDYGRNNNLTTCRRTVRGFAALALLENIARLRACSLFLPCSGFCRFSVR